MLRILGSHRRLCDGLTRRDLLRVSGLGLAGLALGGQAVDAGPSAAAPRPSFGKAKALILLHLYGSPSQLEWCDAKPNAPLEIRGDLKHIPSALPGCEVCELLPKMAQIMDRLTVIRSMTHEHPIHGVAFALTGVPTIDVAMELAPHDPRHWPFFGSVVDYLEAQAVQAGRAPRREIPANVALPFPFSSQRVGEVPRAGPYAAFLGNEYDPIWTSFSGRGTRGHRKTLQQMVYEDNDPYMGTSPDAYFEIPTATSLQPEITLDRLQGRRSLLEQFDEQRRELEASASGRQLDRHQQTAYGMLQSDALRTALDVRREPEHVRAMYGHFLFGQACLAARRLVEAGGRVVTVFWDEFGLAGTGWDTHWNHYPRMRNELCPGLDLALYGLISDLDQRGMLDETLVVVTSEHGRTPQLNKAEGGGRDHWSRVYTTLMAGGGVARGRIVGASDKHGSDVADRPVSPKDQLATMYYLLGIDHEQRVHDNLGRELPLVEGEIVREVLA
jgi:hypothetical protein